MAMAMAMDFAFLLLEGTSSEVDGRRHAGYATSALPLHVPAERGRASPCLRVLSTLESNALVAINIHRPTEVYWHESGPAEGYHPVALAADERVLQLEVEPRSRCIICVGPSDICNDQGPWASLCLVRRSEDDGPQGHMGSVWAAAQVKP